VLTLGLAGAIFAADFGDPFSPIPVARKIVPAEPAPSYTWPKLVTRDSEMSDPRESTLLGLIGRKRKGCGVTLVSLFISETGAITDAKVSSSSGFDYLDDAAIKHTSAVLKYAPATFDGRPVAMWALQKVNFGYGNPGCEPAPMRDDVAQLEEEYRQPMRVLLQQAAEASERRRVEQQRAVDAQEAARFKTEEPYRAAPRSGAGLMELARRANDLYWNWLQCGSSRFAVENDLLEEYRGAQIWFSDADSLSRIDRANGFEFRGRFGFTCEMRRELPMDGESPRWSPWRACAQRITTVWKQDGKWYASGRYQDEARRPLTCATIPR